MSKLWQHPYVNLFKHYNISEWKKCAKEGDVTPVMDKQLKCTIYRIAGSIPAGNYIQFPRTSTQSLSLTGRYLYVLFKPISGKYFVAHIDVATEDGLAIRISFSNLFKEFKSTSTWLQFPFVPRPPPGSVHEAILASSNSHDNLGHVSVSTRYTFLMLDLQHIVSFYLNQKYAYLKNIRLCANMLIKGVFTSDTEYEPGLSINEARKLGLMSTGYVPVPREMAFHVPKGTNWNELYDLVKFPGKSKPVKKGIIHGNGLMFKDEPLPDENVPPGLDEKSSKQHQAVCSRVALVDKLSPKRSKGKRRQVVATHVPAVGLEVPVGIQPKDHLDTQVYAYKSSSKVASTRVKDQPIITTDKPREIKDKKKIKFSEKVETDRQDRHLTARRGFKSLKPDPILKLKRIVGYGGATFREVLWTRNGACVVYPCHAVIVSMEISTGHQRFFIGHTDKVSALTFNGNTSILASGQLGQSTVIRLWRYHSGDCIAIFNSQVRSLHSLSFSNSGGVLCGSGKDNHGKQMVVVWDTSRCGKSGEVSVIAKAHTDVDIARIKIAPFDDTRMVSCGRDNIRFWRVRHGSLRSCPVDLGSNHSIDFTDVCFGHETVDGNNKKHRFIYVSCKVGSVFEVNCDLIVVHKVRRLLPTSNRQDVVETSSEFGIGINCISVNEAFCVTGSDDGYLRLWPLDFSGVILEAEHDGPVLGLDINIDGLSVLAATLTGNIGILDMSTRSYKTLMRSHTQQILSCSFDPSRRCLVTVSDDETIRVWDLDTLCQLYDFRAANEKPCAVTYHPHQQLFACGFRNGAVRVFNIATATMLAEHREHKGLITGLAFSPNGEHMYSAGSHGILVLFEGSTEDFSVQRMLVNTVARGDHFAPDVLAVSDDSQRLAIIGPSEYVITVMDTRTLDEVLRIDITTMNPDNGSTNVDSAVRLCYAPTSLRQLLVVTAGCRLLKLDAYSGQLLSEITNIHRSKCSSLNPFSTGHFLATAGDKVLKIWDYHMRMDLNFQVFIGHSEVIVKACFTPDLLGLVSIGEAIFIWDFLGDGRVPLEPGGREEPTKFISDEPDKSVRVSGNLTLNEDAISESEHRPRPPVTATELPSRPRPSPSPSKAKQTRTTSPVKQLDMMDSFNPLVTKAATVPQNTPEKNQTSDVNPEQSINPKHQPDTDHPIPTVAKHYKRLKSSTALPDRKYTAPPSQAGLVLQAVLDYNGDGRGNMCWHPETGLFVFTSGCIIIIEDLHDGKQRHLLRHVEEISTLALQHDVQVLASASGSSDMVASRICIWNLQSAACRKVLTYHAYEIVNLAYSRDDRFLISVGDYRECSVVIWGTKDYNVLTSSYTKSPIHDLSWDPYTMNEFVSVGQDGNVLFWLLDETRGSFNLNVCEAKVPDDLLYPMKEADSMTHFTSVRYAGDSILYIGNSSGILSAWDTRQNKCFMHWEADDSEIDIIVCHRGSLITGSSSGHLRLWSVVGVGEMRLPGENNVLSEDGLVIEDEMSLDAGIVSASFDASLEMGIVGTMGGTLWYINWTERTSIRLVSSHTQRINSLMASGPDDKYFATCSDDGSLRVWTANELEQTLQFQVMGQRCNYVSFCPIPQPEPTKSLTNDGQFLATVHPHEKPVEKPLRPSHCVAGYDDGTVRLFDLGRVEMIMKIHPHAGAVTAITFSAYGRVFMSGGIDGVVAISSPATGLTVRLIQDHKGAPITDMDIAPEKDHHPSFSSPRLWLIASADRRVSVWSTDWSKDFCELVDWLTFPAPGIAPDGTALKKDDVSSYSHLPPSLARFSPSEPDVIVYTGYGLRKLIQFYSLSQRKVIRTISLTQWATCLEISPKGHLIAVGTKERLVKVLDYHEGSFQDFDGHCNAISNVQFSPSGEKLFSVGYSDVILWKVLI